MRTWTIKYETGLGDKSWHHEIEVEADDAQEALNESVRQGVRIDSIYSVENEP